MRPRAAPAAAKTCNKPKADCLFFLTFWNFLLARGLWLRSPDDARTSFQSVLVMSFRRRPEARGSSILGRTVSGEFGRQVAKERPRTIVDCLLFEFLRFFAWRWGRSQAGSLCYGARWQNHGLGNLEKSRSVGGVPVLGRAKRSPYFVIPSTKPPCCRKNCPSSTPMKRSSRSERPVGS